MGMFGCLRRISAQELERLLAHPDQAEQITGSAETEDGEGYDPEDWWPKGPLLDLEKPWHVIHYLLTDKEGEDDSPLGNAILGGKEVVAEFGQGNLRYLTAGQVKEVAGALAAVDENMLQSKWVPANRRDVYGWPWGRVREIPRRGLLGKLKGPAPIPEPSITETEESWNWVMDRFHALRSFYAEAARNSDAVILWVD